MFAAPSLTSFWMFYRPIKVNLNVWSLSYFAQIFSGFRSPCEYPRLWRDLRLAVMSLIIDSANILRFYFDSILKIHYSRVGPSCNMINSLIPPSSECSTNRGKPVSVFLLQTSDFFSSLSLRSSRYWAWSCFRILISFSNWLALSPVNYFRMIFLLDFLSFP